ncbi:ubiquitin-like-specific protease 1 [Tasmannia lanceolata]|uniref:ubiquitin-like-specific protease 1 n=1 Tax=Tasmannia lanceolata TaxID=3420 RepID=UPI004064C507
MTGSSLREGEQIERLLKHEKGNHILMEKDDVHLIAEDLQHLWNVRQYLTCTIVDIYGKHVQSSNEDGLADPRGGIVFVPSMVHGTLTAVGSEVTDEQRVEKWKTAKDALHGRLIDHQFQAVKMVALLKEYFKERGCDIDHFQYAQMDNFPQQANGFDCGLFVLKAIEHLYAKDPFTFTKCDIPAYRLQLCERFLHGEFEDCGDFLKGDI